MKHEHSALAGRRILVTGASSGLGAHFARTLAAQGAHLALAARRTERLAQLVSDIEQAGGTAQAFSLDVNDAARIEPRIAHVQAALGGIDVLVNNSGISETHRLEDVTPAEFDALFTTNVRGAFFVAQAVARGMIAAGGTPGSRAIVNVASSAGLKPLPRIGPYAAGKAALIHLTRSMALEWGRYGVNANVLCPGYIATELNESHWQDEQGLKLLQRLPRRRLGRPQDLDGPLLLLCSASSGFMNGAVVAVDDGLSA
ncbi:MAG TPA: SDR family NAD(P)-dependent oxidoreductase [Ramlibacter sp.]|nr:SDR family NAD(P)-dependent oxidoreductase [Ramlibacter sp.]